MVPLHAARISDLGPDDWVRVECVCQSVVIFPPRYLVEELRLSPNAKILDLERRLRCRQCGERGKAVVSVKWAV